MKRIALITLFSTLAIIVSAQYNRSVCGIPYGTSRDVAKKMLEKRFGYAAVTEENGDLSVFEGSAGGINYKFMDFFFTWENGVSKLDGAYFSRPYELSEQQKAIEMRDFIRNVYSGKYYIDDYKNDDGFRCYTFWENKDDFDTANDIAAGCIDGAIGSIGVHKGKGKDGKQRLYLYVRYYSVYDDKDDI